MIEINASKSTPKVVLDSENSQYLIEGQSYPENSSSFYKPIINWINDYMNEEFNVNVVGKNKTTKPK